MCDYIPFLFCVQKCWAGFSFILIKSVPLFLGISHTDNVFDEMGPVGRESPAETDEHSEVWDYITKDRKCTSMAQQCSRANLRSVPMPPIQVHTPPRSHYNTVPCTLRAFFRHPPIGYARTPHVRHGLHYETKPHHVQSPLSLSFSSAYKNSISELRSPENSNTPVGVRRSVRDRARRGGQHTSVIWLMQEAARGSGDVGRGDPRYGWCVAPWMLGWAWETCGYQARRESWWVFHAWEVT